MDIDQIEVDGVLLYWDGENWVPDRFGEMIEDLKAPEEDEEE